jgi:hypothetical protein
MPYPYSSSRPGLPRSVAVAVSRRMTSTADSWGNFARTNATTPATIAVELLVPSPVTYLPNAPVETMSTAGAASTTSGPVAETAA